MELGFISVLPAILAVVLAVTTRNVLLSLGAAVFVGCGIFEFRRAVVSNTPRAPFCMIGNCYECLVEVEGKGLVQACLTEVSEGMRVNMGSLRKPAANRNDSADV